MIFTAALTLSLLGVAAAAATPARRVGLIEVARMAGFILAALTAGLAVVAAAFIFAVVLA